MKSPARVALALCLATALPLTSTLARDGQQGYSRRGESGAAETPGTSSGVVRGNGWKTRAETSVETSATHGTAGGSADALADAQPGMSRATAWSRSSAQVKVSAKKSSDTSAKAAGGGSPGQTMSVDGGIPTLAAATAPQASPGSEPERGAESRTAAVAESSSEGGRSWAGLRASAIATTFAVTTGPRADAGAMADARAFGPYTSTSASTRTMARATSLMRAAVAVAGAVAGAFASEEAQQQGMPKGLPKGLIDQAIARADAQAMATGQRTFTATAPRALTTVREDAVIAEAYSTSVAISYGDPDVGVTNDKGRKGEPAKNPDPAQNPATAKNPDQPRTEPTPIGQKVGEEQPSITAPASTGPETVRNDEQVATAPAAKAPRRAGHDAPRPGPKWTSAGAKEDLPLPWASEPCCKRLVQIPSRYALY